MSLHSVRKGDIELVDPRAETVEAVQKKYAKRERESPGNGSIHADDGGNASRRIPHLLNRLFSDFNSARIRWCILRNYEGLPTALLGRDLDILVHPDDLLRTIEVVYRVSEVSVTRLLPSRWGASVCVDGVQLDFISALTWRGQPYLKVDDVLARSTDWRRWSLLRVPDETDKAIVTLFQSCLATGAIKGKYRDEISAAFSARREQAIARLSLRVGVKLAVRLVSRIVQKDYDGAVRVLQSAGWRLLLQNLGHNPVLALSGLCTYYWERIRNLISPGKVITVAFVGVDGTGKSTVLAEAEKALRPAACNIERRYFRPKILYDRGPQKIGDYIHPHDFPQHSALVSIVRAMVWCAEYWLAIFFASRKGAALQFYDRYFHDVLVDPKRCGYGGPGWFVRVLDACVVEPDLWVLLDAPPEVTCARKPEFSLADTARFRLGYQKVIASRRSVLVVDTTQPLEQVVERVEAAILHLLEQRAAHNFARHFTAPAPSRDGGTIPQES